ncbi:MAG: bifunctional tetrahydrofolate synthase/dihydrofolate synthase [Desulfobacteraceae bacterium 4572_88]|nr:MAG: bifunctional tetrahydrofolate synthase/dihydrofolate synthase [Desulfobacteraceae bacterium 4572_88]RLC16435.1 MAG: bifunctional folylpolyglutamate synthase/dihydrofolate synthase [Deltaproteobacteria bacterium]
MYSLRRFGIKLGLSTIRSILEGLGNPQNRFASIHVAGTNGKGSVASALASVLNAAGYKVGLYTSPHLVRFNERICISKTPISDADIMEAYHAVKAVHCGEREPTFFEFATAMALYEFGRQQVDWAIIETGMGGRLDATNVITPALSVITNISLEHKSYLGDTLTQIAGEKGGIIKPDVPVVTGAKQKAVLSVFREIAEKQNAPLYRMGEAFRVRRNSDGSFSYLGRKDTWREMRTQLSGCHQVDNAALVLAACEILREKNTELPVDHIRSGLLDNVWPGRLEVVSESPFILLDGAHNLSAARNLGKFLSEELADRKITLVVGILDDKPYKAMLGHLLPVCDRVIVTRARIDRALPPETLHAIAKEKVQRTEIIPNVADALNHAVRTASPDAAICVAGSLYVVGEAKEEQARAASS